MDRKRIQILDNIEGEMRNNNWDPHIVTTIRQFLELLRTIDSETFQTLRVLILQYLKDD